MTKVKINSVYVPSSDDGTVFTQPSMTCPEYAEDCTIQGIIKKYGIQKATEVDITQLKFLDTSQLYQTYQDACDVVYNIEDTFANLPSEVRTQFNEDPHNFLLMLDSLSSDEKDLFIKQIADTKERYSVVSDVSTGELQKRAVTQQAFQKPVEEPQQQSPKETVDNGTVTS